MQVFLIYQDGKKPVNFMCWFTPNTKLSEIVEYARKAHPDLLFLSFITRLQIANYAE